MWRSRWACAANRTPAFPQRVFASAKIFFHRWTDNGQPCSPSQNSAGSSPPGPSTSSPRRSTASSWATLTPSTDPGRGDLGGDRPSRILHHQRLAHPPVPELRSLDYGRAIDRHIGGQVDDHRRRNIDPPGRAALGDRRRQPEPLIAAHSLIRRHLEHAQRGLFGQAKPGAHHQVAERCVPRRPPTPEPLVRQTVSGEPPNADFPPPPILLRRQPLHPFPDRIVRIRRRPLLVQSGTVSPPRLHRNRAPRGLRDRIDPHVPATQRPPVEPVDRCNLPVPGSAGHARPGWIATPPVQVGQVVFLGRVPPRASLARRPQERQERREIPRNPTGSSWHWPPSSRSGRSRSTRRRTHRTATTETAYPEPHPPVAATHPSHSEDQQRTATERLVTANRTG